MTVIVILLGVAVFAVSELVRVRDGRRLAANGSTVLAGSTLGGPSKLPEPGTASRAVVQLALVEARHLLRHPAFRVGLLILTPVVFLSTIEGTAMVLSSEDVVVTLLLVPLALSGLIAANRCSLRSRRFATDEMLAAASISSQARTAALLLATLALVPVGVAVTALAVLASKLGGAIGWPHLPVLASGVLWLVGAAMCGVLVARWLPHSIFGPVAVVVIVLLQTNLGHMHEQWRWLHFSPFSDSYRGHEFAVQHHDWHLVYIVGLILLVSAIALARFGIPRSVLMLLVASAALTLPAAWFQTRPPTAAQVATIIGYLENPGGGQVCEQHGTVEYCAFPTWEGWIDEWRDPVEGVRAALPPHVTDQPLAVHQFPLIDIENNLPSRVRAQIDPGQVWSGDSVVRPNDTWGRLTWVDQSRYGLDQLSLAYKVAAQAVGLPISVGWEQEKCFAGGQARTVVALWLAGRSTPYTAEALRRYIEHPIGADGSYSNVDVEGPLSLDLVSAYEDWLPEQVPEHASSFLLSDLLATEALLEEPSTRIGSDLIDNWSAVTDPATSTSELFDLLNVEAPESLAGGSTPVGLEACP